MSTIFVLFLLALLDLVPFLLFSFCLLLFGCDIHLVGNGHGMGLGLGWVGGGGLWVVLVGRDGLGSLYFRCRVFFSGLFSCFFPFFLGHG